MTSPHSLNAYATRRHGTLCLPQLPHRISPHDPPATNPAHSGGLKLPGGAAVSVVTPTPSGSMSPPALTRSRGLVKLPTGPRGLLTLPALVRSRGLVVTPTGPSGPLTPPAAGAARSCGLASPVGATGPSRLLTLPEAAAAAGAARPSGLATLGGAAGPRGLDAVAGVAAPSGALAAPFGAFAASLGSSLWAALPAADAGGGVAAPGVRCCWLLLLVAPPSERRGPLPAVLPAASGGDTAAGVEAAA